MNTWAIKKVTILKENIYAITFYYANDIYLLFHSNFHCLTVNTCKQSEIYSYKMFSSYGVVKEFFWKWLDTCSNYFYYKNINLPICQKKYVDVNESYLEQ